MSVWGRQRDVPFKCLSVFPSLKPDRDFIIYNYCNFLLLSYNEKCLCGYFYTFTLLSGSWGLCKDVTCEFWVILWSHCITNALICMWPMISCWGRTGLGEEEVKWLLSMLFRTWVWGCENSTSKDCLKSLEQLYPVTGVAANLNCTHYLLF